MTKSAVNRAVAIRDAIRTIPKTSRSGDTLLSRILGPLFRLLPLDVQARLARDTMIDFAAAYILAKERLGEAGNVRLDGNECQIGVVTANGDFEILAQGKSWESAWKTIEGKGT